MAETKTYRIGHPVFKALRVATECKGRDAGRVLLSVGPMDVAADIDRNEVLCLIGQLTRLAVEMGGADGFKK